MVRQAEEVSAGDPHPLTPRDTLSTGNMLLFCQNVTVHIQ